MHHRHSSATTTMALAAASLLLTALTACSTAPEPIIEPTPSQTPTVSEPPDSPTTTPSPEPESAKAFIRRWQDETFAMQSSGDSSSYSAMTRDCSSCDDLVAEVEKIYESGGSVRTEGGRVLAIERVGKVDEVAIYEYQVRSKPSQVLDSDGELKSDFTGGESRFQINLSRMDDSWVVLRVSRLAS